jgi:ribosome-associated heat shock protein Hsp15
VTSPDAATVRVDVWTWAVRLYPSRSAAATACRAGHVKVNGTSVKPAHPVRLGDLVRARRSRDERIVVVTGLIDKRVGAALAVDNYEDRTPRPAPRETTPAPVLRERGSGRPTKRDRRQVERLRGRD